MHRRSFLGITASLLLKSRTGYGQAATVQTATVQTVLGPIAADDLGVTLMHEHVLVDFIGADKVSRDRYDAEEAFRTALPFLKRVRGLGCRTLVDCTPAYIGRDAALLRRLAQASGLHLVTNTGYYGAADDKFVPRHAYTETAEQLAGRWTREARDGIEQTGIKPGIMKIGVDKGPLSEIDAKLVRAAAKTHLESGLSIASHTGDGTAALAQIDLLNSEGVDGSALIWVHAQSEPDGKNVSRPPGAGPGSSWTESAKKASNCTSPPCDVSSREASSARF